MCIVEIQPRNGGADAADCAGELATALTRHLGRLDQKVLRSPPVTRVVTLLAPGMPAARLAWVAGVHRFQHRPPRQHGKRETSLVVVAVLDEVQAGGPDISADDLKIEVFRGTGPGGQHRNTSDTAVRVTHLPTGRTQIRTSGRSQTANKARAIRELQAGLAADAAAAAAEGANQARREQADPSPAFTHTEWRGEVTCHATGQRWSMRAWAQGRMSSE